MTKPTTILDLSRGLAYGLLYRSVIGPTPIHHPLILKFKKPAAGRKKKLV